MSRTVHELHRIENMAQQHSAFFLELFSGYKLASVGLRQQNATQKAEYTQVHEHVEQYMRTAWTQVALAPKTVKLILNYPQLFSCTPVFDAVRLAPLCYSASIHRLKNAKPARL